MRWISLKFLDSALLQLRHIYKYGDGMILIEVMHRQRILRVDFFYRIGSCMKFLPNFFETLTFVHYYQIVERTHFQSWNSAKKYRSFSLLNMGRLKGGIICLNGKLRFSIPFALKHSTPKKPNNIKRKKKYKVALKNSSYNNKEKFN